MAVEIGALRALLSLDSAAFVKGAERAQVSMGKMQRRIAKLGGDFRKFGTNLTTRVSLPIVAATGLMSRASFGTIDAQAKLAQSLGTSVVSMQNLSRAAELAGVSTSGLEQLSKDLTRRLSQAAAGGGPAADALAKLGLSARELTSLPLDERIALINTRIAEFVPEAERAAVAGKLFGEEGSIAASRLDAATIAAATAEIERFGVAVSDVDADKIEAANDAMSSLGLVTVGLGNQLAVALAPALVSISEKIAQVADWFSQLSPETQKYIGIGAALAAALGPVVVALGLMATGVAALISPIGLVVAGIAALAAGAIAFWPEILRAKDALIEFGRDGVDWIKGKFAELIDFFRTLPDQMIQIGSDIIEGLKQGILEKWESVKGSVLGVGENLKSGFKDLFGIESPSKVFREIGQFLMQGLGLGVSDGVRDAQDALGRAADGLTSKLDTLGRGADAVSDRFGDMFAGIITGSRDAGSVLAQLGNKLLGNTISSVAKSSGLTDFLGKIGGGIFAGLFDSGGFIPRGQFGIASERRAELVNGVLVPGPARVTGGAATARLMSGGTGQVFNQTFNVSVQGGSDDPQKIVDALRPAMRQEAAAIFAREQRRGF